MMSTYENFFLTILALDSYNRGDKGVSQICDLFYAYIAR